MRATTQFLVGRVLVGLILLFAVVPAGAQATSWVLYTHPDKLMSVRFPGVPTESEQDLASPIGNLKLKMAMVANADRAFLATAMIYPIDPKTKFDAKAALEGAREKMLANVKGKVTAEKPITLDGYTGREVEFEAAGPTGTTIHGSARFFTSAKPPGVYVATAMRMTDKPDPDGPKFLASMHLGKKVEAK
jgi:hypothetical protein